MRDRYERRNTGHSFGATYSGVTDKNRPVLDAFPIEWTDEWEAFKIVELASGLSPRSIRPCINSLVRHGLIEERPSQIGARGEWLRKEQRKKP